MTDNKQTPDEEIEYLKHRIALLEREISKLRSQRPRIDIDSKNDGSVYFYVSSHRIIHHVDGYADNPNDGRAKALEWLNSNGYGGRFIGERVRVRLKNKVRSAIIMRADERSDWGGWPLYDVRFEDDKSMLYHATENAFVPEGSE